MPLDQVQKFLRHKRITTTQIYAETSLHGMSENYVRAKTRREPKALRNMAQLLIHLVVCALSMLVTVVLTSSLLPSLFYALPKALLGCFRGVYSWKLPLFYFGSIFIWTILPGAVLWGAYYLPLLSELAF